VAIELNCASAKNIFIRQIFCTNKKKFPSISKIIKLKLSFEFLECNYRSQTASNYIYTIYTNKSAEASDAHIIINYILVSFLLSTLYLRFIIYNLPSDKDNNREKTIVVIRPRDSYISG